VGASSFAHTYVWCVWCVWCLQVRQYQQQISRTCLFHNTLVSLPTGLGKTLIAAVVMYNFHRWYPKGKIIFCAPTRPLVTQQIEACYNIMGISQQVTAEITGKTNKDARAKLWADHNVFFCTPQTLDNDINENKNFNVDEVVCLVLDEAHKAKGDYAYVKVIRGLTMSNARFRVVGLSATPGADKDSINEVFQNLRIDKLEARTDDDPDVKQYIHEKNVQVSRAPVWRSETGEARPTLAKRERRRRSETDAGEARPTPA